MSENKPVVAIVMGSDSDLPVMQEAAKMLEHFRVAYEIDIVSAHRTPDKMFDYAESAEGKGIRVIIAGAGGAAHLPGMIAAITALPVIGVPIKTSTFSGEDSILSILQMPGGVPVATVALNGAKNAGILAAQIMGVSSPVIRTDVNRYKQKIKQEVEEKSGRLTQVGYKAYLEEMKRLSK